MEKLGKALERKTDRETVVRALAAWDLNYGKPELDDDAGQMRENIWIATCKHLPAAVFWQASVTAMQRCEFYPKPAEVLKFAAAPLGALTDKATWAAEDAAGKGLHPKRMLPREFPHKAAEALRDHATWRRFLDTIDPAHEHYFFAYAAIDKAVDQITVPTPFDRAWIESKYGEKIALAFDGEVAITDRKTGGVTFVQKPRGDATEDQIARVRVAMDEFLGRPIDRDPSAIA